MHLFQILLKSGLYAYQSQLMGYVSTGHCFLNIPTRLLEGLDCHMEFDDIIMGAVSILELTKKFKDLLFHC